LKAKRNAEKKRENRSADMASKARQRGVALKEEISDSYHVNIWREKPLKTQRGGHQLTKAEIAVATVRLGPSSGSNDSRRNSSKKRRINMAKS